MPPNNDLRAKPIIDATGTRIPPELAELLVPGTRLRLFYNRGNQNNRTIEVRAIVDNKVVTRSRKKVGGQWDYRIEDAYYFRLALEHGNLSRWAAKKGAPKT